MNRKTALILCTSGALVAAALLLGKQRGSQATTLTSGPPATPVTSGPGQLVASSADTCTREPAPASAAGKFEHGSLRAALSSHKLLQGSTGEMFVTLDISAQAREALERPPMSLSLVIDRSGSMQGEKLAQAKLAAERFVDRLGARDRVAVVQYDTMAQVLLPSLSMDAAGKARAHAAIRSIHDAGGTNLYDGLVLGRDQILAAAVPDALSRVILLSDGQANAGITDIPTLGQVAGAAAGRGIRITTVGLGEDYNEELMEALAEHGRGHYYYVQRAGDLDTVFRGELDSIQATVARNAEVVLSPACAGVEVLEVYGFTARAENGGMVVPMADLFGGDERRIVARLRVPASQMGMRNVMRVALRYTDVATGKQGTAEVAVGVDITSDALAVESSVNKEVIAEVMKVQSAQVLREAATAYQQGDVGRANSINRAWQSKASSEARRFKLEAAQVAPMFNELDMQAQGMNAYDPGSAEGKDMVKSSKAKARSMSKRK